MAALVPFNRRGNTFFNTGFEDFYNMLDDFFSDGWMSERRAAHGVFSVDVRDNGGEYIIDAELPGVSKEEITIDVENDILKISVNRIESDEQKSNGYIHRERRANSMSRSIRLPDANNLEIKAKLENGVLVVTVPKNDKALSTRRIDIE